MDWSRLFGKKEAAAPRVTPWWGDAFGAPEGPSLRVLKLVAEGLDLRALDLVLRQVGMVPERPVEGRRWRSPTRVAWTRHLPDGRQFLALCGHRADELQRALILEHGFALKDGESAGALLEVDAPGHERFWHIGAPAGWAETCKGEDQQIAEAENFVTSRFPARRAAGASTLARLKLFDRGPWVEEAIVAWEEAQSTADLSFVSLCAHELAWLRAAGDPLADRLHAFVAGLAEDNPRLHAVVRHFGAAPRVDEEHDSLMASVPTEMAAAAVGLPPDKRANYAGVARYEATIAGVTDPDVKAELRLEEAEVILHRYGSGWAPGRLEQAANLVHQALHTFPEERQPVQRARAQAVMARIWSAMGQPGPARDCREDALALLLDPAGGWRDEALAQALIAELERSG